MLTDNLLTKYKIKIQSVGIKLQFDHINDYYLISNVLANMPEYKYYTFTESNSKPIKITLTGLPNFDIDQLKIILTEENIPVPNQIKKLNIRKPRYDQQTIYLLYYKKGETTLNELKKFKSVSNIIVTWSFYRSINRGPRLSAENANYLDTAQIIVTWT